MIRPRIAIDGIGIIGGFGSGVEQLGAALSRSENPLPSRVSVQTDGGPRELPLYRADTSRLEEFFQKRELRRIDHYSRMALLAASMALKDAGSSGPDGLSTGVIVATGYGPHRTVFSFLDSFVREGDSFSSPTQFASSVHNAAAAYLSILLKQRGPSLTVSQFDMSVTSALLTAVCWLQEGQVDRVLFGVVEEYSDVLGYSWCKLFGKEATPDVMCPLDFETQTAIPGEGSSFFVLSLAEDSAPRRYGSIDLIFSGIPLDIKGIVPAGASVIVASDGHRDTGKFYTEMAKELTGIRCFSPLYGSMPVGQAFDIAIAAMVNDEKPVFCLKYSRTGELGVVSVRRD
jgi:3-oxoacyl-[acyl-carrier-protein] synthase II